LIVFFSLSISIIFLTSRQAELEEQRRRQAELEEMARRQAEEEARRKAWDEYNRQQANARELQVLRQREREREVNEYLFLRCYVTLNIFVAFCF
jgi:hypothetical protein